MLPRHSCSPAASRSNSRNSPALSKARCGTTSPSTAPSAPSDRAILRPLAVDGTPRWRCARDDFLCAIGGYRASLWPRTPATTPSVVQDLLGRRLRAVHLDFVSLSQPHLTGERWRTSIKVPPGTNLAELRAAARPVGLDVEVTTGRRAPLLHAGRGRRR